jgi:hypothetical protein
VRALQLGVGGVEELLIREGVEVHAEQVPRVFSASPGSASRMNEGRNRARVEILESVRAREDPPTRRAIPE